MKTATALSKHSNHFNRWRCMWHVAYIYVLFHCLFIVSPLQNRFQFQCFDTASAFISPRAVEVVDCRIRTWKTCFVEIDSVWESWIKQWRSPMQIEPLSAKCHRCSIQYTSYRPVNRLFINRANAITHAVFKSIIRFRSFVILSFRFLFCISYSG